MSAAPLGELTRAADRARSLGRPVLCFVRRELSDWPSAIDLFAVAGARGERRFLALHPAEGFEQLALGCVARLGPGADPQLRDVGDAIRATRASVATSLCDAVRGEGARPTVVGGFAFDVHPTGRRDPAWADFGAGNLVVPELLFLREGEQMQLVQAVRVSPEDRPDDLARVAHARFEAAFQKAPERRRGRDVAAEPSPRACYEPRVSEAVAALRRGELHKVVLAECVDLTLPSALHEGSTLRALCAASPASRTFAQGIGDALFLGATPERIVRLRGDELASDAVAGTRPAPEAREEREALGRELLASDKDRAEHAWVVRHLVEGLAPLCETLSADAEPSLVRAGSMQHLRTRVRGRAAQDSDVLGALARLHPSPALAGTPRNAALACIRRLEDFDRGWYGGPIGWMDAHGDGDFFAALRCGLVSGRRVRLYAGSGLVPSSRPAAERSETALKLGTLWRALHAA